MTSFLTLLLAAVLVVPSSMPAGQPAQAPAVKDAQAALIDALTRHDKAAFERLIDADAVFFLPALSQGREAILTSWSLFVLPTNASMALTPADAVVSGSQDLAYTTGTFLFSVDQNGKPVTVMSGTYLMVWRLVGGKWMAKSFAGGGQRSNVNLALGSPNGNPGAWPQMPTPPVNPASLANGGGLGPYRFGMPLEEVRKVDACKPYMDVRTTGGLECPNYTFEGRKMNISFIFVSNALRRIQLWLYEGESEKDTRKATDFGIDFMKRTAGGAHMYGLGQGVEVNGEAIVKALKDQQPQPGRGVMTEIQTPSSDSPEKWFSRISRTPTPQGVDWFAVMLFVEARLPPAR